MKLISTLRAWILGLGLGGAVNAAILAGGALVSHGVGRIYAPAGEIVAGLALIGLAYLASRAA